MDFWVYPLRPNVPSWIWIRCIYSATYRNTFMSPLTFAISTVTCIHAQTFSYFYSAYLFWRHYSPLQNLQDFKLLAERQMPAHPFYKCFPYHYDDPHKGFLLTQAVIELLNWNLSVSSFDLFIFSFKYNEGKHKLPSFVKDTSF